MNDSPAADGALTALESSVIGRSRNEFTPASVSFQLAKELLIEPPYDDNLIHRYKLELRLATIYGVAAGQQDKAYELAELSARARMADFLYRDVISDLHDVMGLCSEGKRDEAMDRIGTLIRRLRS